MRKHHIWTRNFSVKENKPVNFRVLTRIYFVNIMTWSVYKINRVILLSTDLKLWRSESLPEAIWIGCLNSVLWLLVTVEIRQQEKNLYMKKIHLPSIIIWTKLPLNLYSKLQLSLVQANSNFKHFITQHCSFLNSVPQKAVVVAKGRQFHGAISRKGAI